MRKKLKNVKDKNSRRFGYVRKQKKNAWVNEGWMIKMSPAPQNVREYENVNA